MDRSPTAKQLYRDYFAQSHVLIALALTLLVVYLHIATKQSVCSTWPDCPIGNMLLDARQPNNWLNYSITGSMSLIVLGLALISILQQKPSGKVFIGSCLMSLIVLQFVCGHVNLKLQHNPIFATTHMTMGFIIAAIAWWLALMNQSKINQPLSAELNLLKPWAIIALIMLTAQIVLGVWSSASYASQTFNHLASNGHSLQMLHRFGAYLMTAFIVPFALCLIMIRGQENLQHLGTFLLATLAIEFALGICDLIWQFPMPLTILHTGLAGLVLLIMTTIIYRLFVRR